MKPPGHTELRELIVFGERERKNITIEGLLRSKSTKLRTECADDGERNT